MSNLNDLFVSIVKTANIKQVKEQPKEKEIQSKSE